MKSLEDQLKVRDSQMKTLEIANSKLTKDCVDLTNNILKIKQ
jgi:hypothetical protein